MAPENQVEYASAVHAELPAFAIEHHNRLDKPEDIQRAADAQAATAKEHNMTLWQGLKLYPKAIGWSLLFSTVIIMEGYDVVLMGSFYAYPTFRKKYGNLQPDGSYELPGAVSSVPLYPCAHPSAFTSNGIRPCCNDNNRILSGKPVSRTR